jgi:hypothetical protein
MTHSDHSTGNPNAKQLTSQPDAVSSGRRIAPAPPGQVSYISNRCGVARKDGSICTNYPLPGRDTCLGHTPKVPNAET